MARVKLSFASGAGGFDTSAFVLPEEVEGAGDFDTSALLGFAARAEGEGTTGLSPSHGEKIPASHINKISRQETIVTFENKGIFPILKFITRLLLSQHVFAPSHKLI